MTIEQIIADHSDLERDDLLAALEFGVRERTQSGLVAGGLGQ